MAVTLCKIKKWVVFTLVLEGFIGMNPACGDANDIKLKFELKYQAWREHCSKILTVKSDIDPRLLFDDSSFEEIVGLGVDAIPYILERQQENHLVGYALSRITKYSWHTVREGDIPDQWVWTVEEFPELRSINGPIDSRILWLRWWNKGKQETVQNFKKLYPEWKMASQLKETKSKYQKFLDLGIAALPVLMEKIGQGERELISVASQLTDGKIDPNASPSQCVLWWRQNKTQWLIPFPNKQPVANAGEDKQVVAGEKISLDGSGSTDADQDDLSCQWRQVSGPTVTLADAHSVQTSFTVPPVSQPTTMVFELVVNDGSPEKSVHSSCQPGLSKPDTVTITAVPQ